MAVRLEITSRRAPVIAAVVASAIRAIRIGVGVVDFCNRIVVAARVYAEIVFFLAYIVIPYIYPTYSCHVMVRRSAWLAAPVAFIVIAVVVCMAERSPFREAPVAVGVCAIVVYVPVIIEVTRHRASVIVTDDAIVIRAVRVTVCIVDRQECVVTAQCTVVLILLAYIVFAHDYRTDTHIVLMEAPVAYEVRGIIIYMPVLREST